MLEYHCIGHGHEGCAKRARKNDVFCVKQHPFGRDGMCTVHNHYWVLHWVFGCNFFQSCSEISLFVKMNERISEIDTKYVALLHATTGSFAGSGRAVMDRAPWLYDLFMQWNARLPLLNYSNCGLANEEVILWRTYRVTQWNVQFLEKSYFGAYRMWFSRYHLPKTFEYCFMRFK